MVKVGKTASFYFWEKKTSICYELVGEEGVYARNFIYNVLETTL
jgi:hypothetical protein